MSTQCIDLGLEVSFRANDLPDELLRHCLCALVVPRPKLPPHDGRGLICTSNEDQDDVQAVATDTAPSDDAADVFYPPASPLASAKPQAAYGAIVNLPWDGGGYDLHVASRVCKRWHQLAMPLCRKAADALRADVEALAGEVGRGVRQKRMQSIFDGHRGCLLAEGLACGALALCEHFAMYGDDMGPYGSTRLSNGTNVPNPPLPNHVEIDYLSYPNPYSNPAGPAFGLALARALRRGALAHLLGLELDSGFGDGLGVGLGEHGCVALGDALAGGALPQLTNLGLGCNRIGCAGAISLAAAAAHGGLQHAESINLAFNPAAWRGGRGLSLALQGGALPRLRQLQHLATHMFEQLGPVLRCSDGNGVVDREWPRRLQGSPAAELKTELCALLVQSLRAAGLASESVARQRVLEMHAPCLARLASKSFAEASSSILESVVLRAVK